jgi:ribosomal protein S18 acetylase RimI-like enzyme
MEAKTTVRCAENADELDALEPLWNALQEHHSEVLPALGGQTRPRPLTESWIRRRTKYEGWLDNPESFFIVAEEGQKPVGYAFVTIGPGYAGWSTGRLAELETLSVLPEHRGARIGGQLLDAVWSRLAERGVEEMAITTAIANVDSHRFYERHGFQQGFVIYYGKRDAASQQRLRSAI